MDSAFILKKVDRAGLVYVSGKEPGIRRERRGRGFCYRFPDGSLVRDPAIRQRIAKLGIPPAHERVWICLDPNGHLQATGFDARGRKQYRYHDAWQALRAELKFGQLIAFGEKLPHMRRKARIDAGRSDDRQRAILGALVLLLDAAHLRAGNEEYLQENGSFGATTLLKRHLRFGNSLSLRFKGKSGRSIKRELHAPGLQRILEKIADLPGRRLFGWRDEEGRNRSVDSGLLNHYLSEIGGEGISAKVFRTWGGTLAAFETAATALKSQEVPSIKAMCEAASQELANTTAVCRKSYVHPEVLSIATDAGTRERLERQLNEAVKPASHISVMEQRLLRFLRTRDR